MNILILFLCAAGLSVAAALAGALLSWLLMGFSEALGYVVGLASGATLCLYFLTNVMPWGMLK